MCAAHLPRPSLPSSTEKIAVDFPQCVLWARRKHRGGSFCKLVRCVVMQRGLIRNPIVHLQCVHHRFGQHRWSARRLRFSRSNFKPSASWVVSGIVRGVAGGCGSSSVPSPDVSSCLTTLMGGTEACAFVGGDASGVPSPFLLWPTAVNAAGTVSMSLDSEVRG